MEGSEASGAALGKRENSSTRKMATERGNLLGVCRMCIKSLVDKAAFEVITDDCPHVVNFCTVMEHIFTHRIQVRWTLFSGVEATSFWHVVCRLLPSVSQASIRDMEAIQTELGRGRAWVRLSLVQKKLATHINTLITRSDILRSMYLPGAFLCSEEASVLAGTLKCLGAIDFNLCLRGQDFDFPDKDEIDYSPYLTFRQNVHSVADDSEEYRKLRTPQTDRPRQLGSGRKGNSEGEEEEEEEEEDEEERELEGQELIAQLREMVKTEREQKNYFEELVSVRDLQLSNTQTELSTLTSDSERQKQELEEVVLELQQQLERQRTELRAAHHQKRDFQGSRSESEEPHTDQNGASDGRRKRTGTFSLLSGLFGD